MCIFLLSNILPCRFQLFWQPQTVTSAFTDLWNWCALLVLQLLMLWSENWLQTENCSELGAHAQCIPSLRNHRHVLTLAQCLKNIASYILSSCKVEGLVWHWLFCHGRKQKFTLIFEFLFCLKILLNFLKLSTSFYFWHNHLVHNDCFFFSIFISSLLCYNVE